MVEHGITREKSSSWRRNIWCPRRRWNDNLRVVWSRNWGKKTQLPMYKTRMRFWSQNVCTVILLFTIDWNLIIGYCVFISFWFDCYLVLQVLFRSSTSSLHSILRSDTTCREPSNKINFTNVKYRYFIMRFNEKFLLLLWIFELCIWKK